MFAQDPARQIGEHPRPVAMRSFLRHGKNRIAGGVRHHLRHAAGQIAAVQDFQHLMLRLQKCPLLGRMGDLEDKFSARCIPDMKVLIVIAV